jgi:sugar lactone lactonase YvrE
MKDDIRTLVDQVMDAPVPDQWEEIQERSPRGSAPDLPTKPRRVAAAAIALIVSVAAFTFAFEAFRNGSPPADESFVSSTPAPGPALTGSPRIVGEVNLPANTSAGDIAVGAGSVWAEGWPSKGGGDNSLTRNSLIRIDPATDQIIATIPVPAGSVVATNDAVWVTGEGLHRIDPSTNTIIADVAMPGGVSAIVATDGGVWAVVIGPSSEGALVRVDPATNEIVAKIPLGSEITGYQDQVLVGAGSVWVLGVRWNGKDEGSEEYGGDLIRVDPSTDQVVDRIPVDGFQMAVGDDAVWVKFPQDGVFDSSDEQWLWTKVDVSTDEPSAPFRLDAGSLDLITPEALWSVDYDDADRVRVARFDPNTHELQARSDPIPSYFSGAVIDPTTGSVWISTMETITRVDIAAQPDS